MWESLQTKCIPYQTCENSFRRQISWVKSHVGSFLTELKVLFNLRSILNLKDVRKLLTRSHTSLYMREFENESLHRSNREFKLDTKPFVENIVLKTIIVNDLYVQIKI